MPKITDKLIVQTVQNYTAHENIQRRCVFNCIYQCLEHTPIFCNKATAAAVLSCLRISNIYEPREI